MTNTILECKDLTVVEDGCVLLDKVSISFGEAQIHLVIGENGAGKSLLMKCLAGIQKYDAGITSLEGVPQTPYTLAEAQRKGIFMLFHDVALMPNLTVMENIFIKHWIKDRMGCIDWKRQTKTAKRILQDLKTGIKADALVGSLGRAEQRIVEIAKAIYLKLKVLILDESFSELTDTEADYVFGVLENIRDTGTSICIVTHKYSKMLEKVDCLSVMKAGKVVITAEKNEVPAILKKLIVPGVARYPQIKKKHLGTVLKVEGLADDYVLKEITFQANKGEILGITGMMGSGRTCLSKLLTGVQKPRKGRLIYRGKVQRFSSPEEARKAGIVYLPEDNNRSIVPGFGVSENITLGNMEKVSKLGFVDLKLEQYVGTDYSKRLGIDTMTFAKQAKTLSNGSKQKVVWAKNIFSHSTLFVMDEPTKGLDSASKVDIYNLMNAVSMKGNTIIMMSSNYEELVAMCDRILILYDGKIAAELIGDALLVENIVKYSYQ